MWVGHWEQKAEEEKVVFATSYAMSVRGLQSLGVAEKVGTRKWEVQAAMALSGDREQQQVP